MTTDRRHFLGLLALLPLPGLSAETVTSSLALTDLAGSAQWPAPLQKLISYALSLTSRKLGYQFGSSDPALGGMDCSGTIHHTLKQAGIKDPPRQADAFHEWVDQAGLLVRVTGTPELKDPVWARMKPGDLLFWTGTYNTGERRNPISHVMLYLGKTKDGQPVMFGASDGRPYRGKRQNGVSVFDFRLPKASGTARFVGYGSIPGMDLRNIAPVPPG